jgi:low affinity Fe/Cu permease
VPTARTSPPAAKAAKRKRVYRWRVRRWQLYLTLAVTIPAIVVSVLIGYYYVTFSRMIDARLHGEVQRTDPRIFARPFVVRRGQRVTMAQMIDRLNELGYAHRDRASQPGEFAIGRDALAAAPRRAD